MASFFVMTSCAATNQQNAEGNPNKNSRIFNGGLERVTRLTADALRDQGLAIDHGSSNKDKNAYIIVAHLNNEYVAGASQTGYSNNPRETQLKIVISYISDMKTKVEINSDGGTYGVRSSYRKDVNNQIFNYIRQHL